MFRMPAEWAPHAKTWMAWPCRAEVWGERLAETQQAYSEIARAIARFEPVSMLVPPGQEDAARNRLGCGIELVPMEIDDSWARDSGPCFLSDVSSLWALCFRFNAWGGKYSPYDKDAEMARNIAAQEGIEAVASKLVPRGLRHPLSPSSSRRSDAAEGYFQIMQRSRTQAAMAARVPGPATPSLGPGS
ncbi:MAG: agmatine deiminase family protein [Rhodovibrionaceae bacterium]